MSKQDKMWNGEAGYYGTLWQARIWQGHSKEEYLNVETLRELEIEYNYNRRLIFRMLVTFWREHNNDSLQSSDDISSVVNQAVDRAIDEIVEALGSGQLPSIPTQSSTPDALIDLKAKAKAMFQANKNRDRGSE